MANTDYTSHKTAHDAADTEFKQKSYTSAASQNAANTHVTPVVPKPSTPPVPSAVKPEKVSPDAPHVAEWNDTPVNSANWNDANTHVAPVGTKPSTPALTDWQRAAAEAKAKTANAKVTTDAQRAAEAKTFVEPVTPAANVSPSAKLVGVLVDDGDGKFSRQNMLVDTPGVRDRVLLANGQHYEHVYDALDGEWVYRLSKN